MVGITLQSGPFRRINYVKHRADPVRSFSMRSMQVCLHALPPPPYVQAHAIAKRSKAKCKAKRSELQTPLTRRTVRRISMSGMFADSYITFDIIKLDDKLGFCPDLKES